MRKERFIIERNLVTKKTLLEGFNAVDRELN